MLVLSWNLFHGRAVPDEPRALLDEFSARLASWDWDVALLQEVPPWWPPRLGAACAASARTALTSRNWLLPLTRRLADLRPDLVKSWGGGANAILVRGQTIMEHRWQTLRRWPERRVVHGVRVEDGCWVSNLHAQAHSEARAQSDVASAASSALAWAGRAPAILAGDMNTRHPVAPGFAPAASHGVDHILIRQLDVAAPGRTLDGGPLSDHVPILADVRPRKDRHPEAS
ncbi:MAG TPA: endonuclease/exonuclease/phosphatase family protein [Solirubrobacteraceae bacterium]